MEPVLGRDDCKGLRNPSRLRPGKQFTMSEELTKQEEKEIGFRFTDDGIVPVDDYDELVDKMRRKGIAEMSSAVRLRWLIGAHTKLVLDTAVYGSHKMKELSEDSGWSTQQLYACKNLYETFSRKELEEKVLDKGITFRDLINKIIRIKDKDERDRVLALLGEGKTMDEVEKLLQEEAVDVTDTTEGAKEGESETDPDLKALSTINSAKHLLEEHLDYVLNRVAPMTDVLSNLDLIADEQVYQQAQDKLEELKTKAAEAEQLLAELLGELEKRCSSET